MIKGATPSIEWVGEGRICSFQYSDSLQGAQSGVREGMEQPEQKKSFGNMREA
jgi:hypothetical protein